MWKSKMRLLASDTDALTHHPFWERFPARLPPSSPKPGFLFHILARNIQLYCWCNRPIPRASRLRWSFVWLCCSTFGLFPVTLTFQTSLFRSDPAHMNTYLIKAKMQETYNIHEQNINIFYSTYLIIVAAPSWSMQEQLRNISVIPITFVFCFKVLMKEFGWELNLEK